MERIQPAYAEDNPWESHRMTTTNMTAFLLRPLRARDPEEKHRAATPLELLRSEEHTSELQSLMRISYAVFCLKKKKKTQHTTQNITLKINKRKYMSREDQAIHQQHKYNY